MGLPAPSPADATHTPSQRRGTVVHLTTNHAPFDTRIFLKEARSLQQAGYDVTIVVPSDQEVTSRDGVTIVRLPVPRNRFVRFLVTPWQAYREARRHTPDVVHLHETELVPVGWRFKLDGTHVLFDAHEDRAKQVLSKAWIPKPLRPLVAMLVGLVEGSASRSFDAVLTATSSIAASFPKGRTTVVQNYPIEHELAAVDPQPYAERARHFVFVGGMTPIRGVREMVRAMHLLDHHADARLLLGGTFAPASFEDELHGEPGWERTEALGWQSREAVARLLASTRAGLVLYHPEPNHLAAQPNKLFEYMSAGLPVLASDFPLWRDLVESADCGLVVNPLDPEAIAGAMAWLLNHPEEAAAMGARGRHAVQNRFNWTAESRHLLGVYEEVLG